jgi:hypothetical protein
MTGEPVEGSVFVKYPTFTCPKHGNIGGLNITFHWDNKEQGCYCLICYKEMVEKHCCMATPNAALGEKESNSNSRHHWESNFDPVKEKK